MRPWQKSVVFATKSEEEVLTLLATDPLMDAIMAIEPPRPCLIISFAAA